MADRFQVVPDGRMKVTLNGQTEAVMWKATAEVDGFMRSTVVRVLDEEIAEARQEQARTPKPWRNNRTWNRHQIRIETLRSIRSRFTEED